MGEWDEDVVSRRDPRASSSAADRSTTCRNRVRTIDDAVERVRDAAPEARVGVAHGQMSEKQLEAVMERFAANEVDVLVATTIIESGIDNPHTNTLIIEDSQRLGPRAALPAQGPRRAAVTSRRTRTSCSRDRLAHRAGRRAAHRDPGARRAGQRHQDRDARPRDPRCGSLLGAEQSGNISAVGFDLFAQMLMEAVSEARGEPLVAHPDIRVDLPLSAFLPEEYVPEVDERVRYYRRLAGSPTIEAVDAVAAELAERYGALPEPARNLVDIARIKALAAEPRRHERRGRPGIGSRCRRSISTTSSGAAGGPGCRLRRAQEGALARRSDMESL